MVRKLHAKNLWTLSKIYLLCSTHHLTHQVDLNRWCSIAVAKWIFVQHVLSLGPRSLLSAETKTLFTGVDSKIFFTSIFGHLVRSNINKSSHLCLCPSFLHNLGQKNKLPLLEAEAAAEQSNCTHQFSLQDLNVWVINSQNSLHINNCSQRNLALGWFPKTLSLETEAKN
jgi:hypothetical protein